MIGKQLHESSAQFMKYLICDLMDYGHIKQGKFLKKIKKFNVITTVREIVSLLKMKAE